MEKLKKYIVENYDGQFTWKQLMSEGIPKLFLKIEAVKKEIARLEAERKKAVQPWKTEKDPKKKEQILNKLKELTKKINAQQKNLVQMLDMEDKYISQMAKDTELDAKAFDGVFEDTDLGHQDDEPGMLRADLSIIERYAEELGEMMKDFDEMDTEIDLPHWWQTKIIKAKDYIIGAKHYLRAELEKTDGILHNKDKK
jgi:Fe2+ transport system protein B